MVRPPAPPVIMAVRRPAAPMARRPAVPVITAARRPAAPTTQQPLAAMVAHPAAAPMTSGPALRAAPRAATVRASVTAPGRQAMRRDKHATTTGETGALAG